jgi:biotin synthase
MTRETSEQWLRETDEARLEELWRQADATRRQHVGDAVHLRGLVEFSNVCVRQCAYCGLRAGNRALTRYRMSAAEILECARQAVEFGYGTVVLQSGEDPDCTAAWLAEVVSAIKRETPLAVTLSVGERALADLARWRAAGADRYLIRFETSNRGLYERIHPALPGVISDRFAILRQLRELGYEVGSGVLVGIPGQTYADLAEDIAWFQRLDLDMIGVGPYIPHPQTPLGRQVQAGETVAHVDADEQPPASELMTYKMVALTRLACPRANIPSTTALATLNKTSGRELGLARGANIVMPNLTPVQYRAYYEIYPAKVCIAETADICHGCMTQRIHSIGRTVGAGRGDSHSHHQRRQTGVAAERIET